MANIWLPTQPKSDQPGIRLFCLHYAGGASRIFSSWETALQDTANIYAVQLPGRWERFQEPPFQQIEPLVQAMSDGLAAEIQAPYAIVGYSLGSLVGFEWIRLLRKLGKPMPRHFFVIARSAPQSPRLHNAIAQLPDGEFMEQMQHYYGGIPENIRNNEELRELFLPIIKADMAILDNYSYRDEAKLDIPITAMRGTNDRPLTAERLAAWKETTTGPFLAAEFDGGHFLAQDCEAEVLNLIKKQLA